MIAKGNQRSGGQNLATHLMNALDNERAEVAEVRGTVANDLHGALLEWFAASKATKCKKYIYSLSVSPDQRQGKLTHQQYLDFAGRVERKLKLQDNARVVVFHVKDGREHCHIVWSRIDTDKMKAVQINHDRQKLRMIVRDFARDHGLELPKGLKQDRNSDRFNEQARQSNHAEKQQEERTGITKEERRSDIAAAWRDSRTGQEFVQMLQDKGYYIAQGDSRDYVIVDMFGEVHSLSRQLTPDVRSKELKARLAEFPPDKLPPVHTAKERVRQWREERLAKLQQQLDGPPPEQLRADLKSQHEKRRAALDQKRAVLAQQHQSERATVERGQRRQEREIAQIRKGREPKGLLAFLGKVTGVSALIARRHRKQDLHRGEAHGAELDALDRKHAREMKEFQRHDRALSRVEKREAHSLETAIRRETLRQAVMTPRQNRVRGIVQEFNKVAEPDRKEKQKGKDRADVREAGNAAPTEINKPRTPVREVFNNAAGAKDAQQQEKQKEKSKPPKITDIFRENATPPKPVQSSTLSRHFKDAASETAKDKPANDRQDIQPRRRRDRGPELDR